MHIANLTTYFLSSNLSVATFCTAQELALKRPQKVRSVSSSFVYPAGSQVVLKCTKPTASEDGESAFKKAGSVGVVIKCPPHNGEPYLVRFSDDTTTSATVNELVLRREEVDNLLAGESDPNEYRPFIFYKCQVGSKAFGLANESSDDDIRGIFLAPAEKLWSLYEVPEQLEFNDGQLDEVFWELEKFLRLALKANPNILETLWSPMVIEASPLADELRGIRKAFLSRHLYKTYSGYALSQFRRMKNSFLKTGSFKHKHAMHLIRLLHSGTSALKTGEIMLDVSEFRSELLKVRNGHYSFDEVEAMAKKLEKEFADAFDKTNLPEQPDFETVDQFLIKARRSAAASQL